MSNNNKTIQKVGGGALTVGSMVSLYTRGVIITAIVAIIVYGCYKAIKWLFD